MVLARLKKKKGVSIIEVLTDGMDLLKVETLRGEKVTDIEYIQFREMEQHIKFLQRQGWDVIYKRSITAT